METGGGVMTVQLPSLKDLTSAFDEFAQRLADPQPAFATTQARYNRVKRLDFETGRAPGGAQPALAASTRRRHKTGVPLWNTKDLGRSFYDPAHPHYHWSQDLQVWGHLSTSPTLDIVDRHLIPRGYKDPVGLSEAQWEYVSQPAEVYIDTGEVVTHA